jgi:AbrB family looped-hinge helix DNA binding protein
MRITSKGQVTIPQEIREKTGLLPNTEVEFKLAKGRVTLRAVGTPKSAGKAAVHGLRGSLKHLKRTTDQLMALTRGDD